VSYTAEMLGLLQTKHRGKWEGSTDHCNAGLAQARGRDAGGTGGGQGVYICSSTCHYVP